MKGEIHSYTVIVLFRENKNVETQRCTAVISRLSKARVAAVIQENQTENAPH